MLKIRILKKSAFVSLCLFSLFIFFSCASNKVVIEEEKAPPLFDDWQYRGFGTEYPDWFEAIVLEKDIEELEVFFPEITGHRSELEINLAEVDDVDSCAHFLKEEEYSAQEAVLLAKTWARVNPYYEEYVFPYIAVKMYLKTEEK